MSAVSRSAAWLIVRLRWPIVLAWTAAAIGAVLYLPNLQDVGEDASLLGLVPEDAESIQTQARMAEMFAVPVVTHTHVVQRDPEGLSRDAVRRIADSARRISEGDDEELREVRLALPIVNAEGLVPTSRENGTTAVTYLFFDPTRTDLDDQEELTARYAATYASEADDALVGITGAVPARIEEWRQIERGLPWVTAATIALIALVLAAHFRSPVAPLVSLLSAGIAYVVSLRAVAWLSDSLGVTVPRDAEPVLVVLLLGVVTDYAIFFLHAMRERLSAGDTRLEAAETATASYLPIVLTAGVIVAGGTASLIAGEIEFFRAFGPGMAFTVLIALWVAVTLVPALLAILGRGAFWPSRAMTEAPPTRPSRLALFATARPVALILVIVAITGLAFACRGLVETNLGVTHLKGLPEESQPKRAEEAAALGFASGILSPTVLLVEGVDPPDELPRLLRLDRALQEEPGVAASIGPGSDAVREFPGLLVSEEAAAARFLLVLEEEPYGARAVAVVARLRERLPALVAEAGIPNARVRLAGDTALAEETIDTINHDLIRIGVVAFIVNFVLLAVFLRALVAPLYLVLSSTLALAAGIGLTTLVFQGLLGHDELTYHVPFAVAVLLLSLGSDYNVFLVGRIWQAAERLPLREAVATAAPRASRAIGVAGVALALSFASLALIDLRQFREFSVAMSVGIRIEVFVVRALLVPALISLFAERSWWPRTRRPRAAPEGRSA